MKASTHSKVSIYCFLVYLLLKVFAEDTNDPPENPYNFWLSDFPVPSKAAAEQICDAKGMKLIIIDTKEKSDAFSKYAPSIKWGPYYIGIERESVKSPWLLSDGREATFFNWAPKEPDNKNYRCIQASYRGPPISSEVWWDYNCNSRSFVACEPDPTKTTPAPPPPPTGPPDNPYGFYLSEYAVLNRPAAIRECERQGKQLVIIDSKEKNDAFGRSILKALHPWASFYIGIQRTSVQTNWYFSDGRIATYFNWGPKEPSNSNREYCVQVNYKNASYNTAVWRDIGCYVQSFVACERNESAIESTVESTESSAISTESVAESTGSEAENTEFTVGIESTAENTVSVAESTEITTESNELSAESSESAAESTESATEIAKSIAQSTESSTATESALKTKYDLYFGLDPVIYSDAEADCENMDMNLVTIEEKEKNDAIQTYLQQIGDSMKKYLTGAVRRGLDGKERPNGPFRWNNLHRLSFRNFMEGMPRNYPDWNRTVIAVINDGEELKWLDVRPTDKYYYICEKPNPSSVSAPAEPENPYNFYFSDTVVNSYKSATIECAKLNMTLVTIYNETKNDALGTILSANDDSSWYLQTSYIKDNVLILPNCQQVQWTNPGNYCSPKPTDLCESIHLDYSTQKAVWCRDSCSKRRFLLCEKISRSPRSQGGSSGGWNIGVSGGVGVNSGVAVSGNVGVNGQVGARSGKNCNVQGISGAGRYGNSGAGYGVGYRGGFSGGL